MWMRTNASHVYENEDFFNRVDACANVDENAWWMTTDLFNRESRAVPSEFSARAIICPCFSAKSQKQNADFWNVEKYFLKK
jgi:hypothetical protein